MRNGLLDSHTSGDEPVLYNFKGGKDGQNPEAGLVYREAGSTARPLEAGARTNGGSGTAFATTPSGAETVLHRFGHRDDGAIPQAALLDVNGTLYGTTYYRGYVLVRNGFDILASGKERVLYNFADHGDGYYPVASLINVKGTLYSTTSGGGQGCTAPSMRGAARSLY